MHSTLHKALKDAMKLGLIARNPADAVESPRCQRHEMHIMNELEMQHFLEEAKATPYYALFYLALFTGLRRSELLALRWSDVDLLLCQLSVSRTIHHLINQEVVFRQTKTEKSRRLVNLSPPTCIHLREHKGEQDQLKLLAGMTISESDLIFSQIDAKPLLPNSITHAWMRIARKCGLKGVRLHDARHTHASLLLKQGVHPKIVQGKIRAFKHSNNARRIQPRSPRSTTSRRNCFRQRVEQYDC
jgi:integrase